MPLCPRQSSGRYPESVAVVPATAFWGTGKSKCLWVICRGSSRSRFLLGPVVEGFFLLGRGIGASSMQQKQLPAQISQIQPEETFLQQHTQQPPPPPEQQQQQQKQEGLMCNCDSHPISKRNSNRLPQSMVASGSASAQSFAKSRLQQQQQQQQQQPPQAPKDLLPQPQQLHQRSGSHHLAPPTIAMQQQQQQQQQTKSLALGYTGSGSGHTSSLPTEALAHSGRIPHITADFAGQSVPQPPSSLPVGTKTNQSRATQVQQDSLLGQSLYTRAICSVNSAQREKAVEIVGVVNVNERKVRVAADFDSTSLYALCRRWVRNDVLRKDQAMLQNFAKLLPKPLPTVKVENEEFAPQDNQNKNGFEITPSLELQDFYEGKVETPNEDILLENHIKNFRNVRKRSREQHKQRIERYKHRLALLLQPSPYQNKVDASLYF